jgi:hypothetical protein
MITSKELNPMFNRTKVVLVGLVLSTVFAMAVTVRHASVAQEPGTGSRATFMRLKLQPVKEILEAIALEDYDRIVAQSQRIHALSLDESWMVIQTDSYRRQSDEFRRAVSVMADAARNRNLDGATLGYMQMTLNCVQCHRQLRNPQPE